MALRYTKFPPGCPHQAQSVWPCLPAPSLGHGQWAPLAPGRHPCGQRAVSPSCRGRWRHRRRRWSCSRRPGTAAAAPHCSLQGRRGRVAQGPASFPWGLAMLTDYPWALGWRKEPEVAAEVRAASCWATYIKEALGSHFSPHSLGFGAEETLASSGVVMSISGCEKVLGAS